MEQPLEKQTHQRGGGRIKAFQMLCRIETCGGADAEHVEKHTQATCSR